MVDEESTKFRFKPNINSIARVEALFAFPSGEGGPLVVDEEIDLPQNFKTPVGRLAVSRRWIKT